MIHVYTLWASLKGEEPSPWLIAAEDEFAWEADPERCEETFRKARDNAHRDGWEVREVTLLVPGDEVYAAFRPVEVEAKTEDSGA